MNLIKLFMRVTEPQHQVALESAAGDNVLLSRKLPVAKPGEMIVVEVPGASLASARGIEARLSK